MQRIRSYPRLMISGVLAATLLAACGGATDAPSSGGGPPQGASQPTATAQSDVEPTAMPAVAAVSAIAAAVSGTGEVAAIYDSELSFLVSGTVSEVLVTEGDTVKAGQVLMRLDLRTFDQQVSQAAASLESAKAQSRALDEPPDESDLAAARAQVKSAQASLDQLNAGPTDPSRRSAEAALSIAQTNLNSQKNALSTAKTQAEAAVEQAVQTLTSAQATYAQAKSNWNVANGTGNDPITPSTTSSSGTTDNKLSDGQLAQYYTTYVQAEAALKQAEQNIQTTKVAAEQARQAEITGVQQAEEQVTQAQASLDALVAAPEADALAQAQASVASAKASLNTLTKDPTESQTASAAAQIAQAEANLEAARINRDNAELKAPFDGMVMSVGLDPGSSSSGAVAIRIVDNQKLRVQVDINDIDIARVQLGQAANVYIDSLPDATFTGKVTYIAPAATISGNVRTFQVHVTLDSVDGLRSGMRARIEIPDSSAAQ